MPLRILIVDDDPGIRAIVRINLEKEGYQVATAENGIEGLEQARAQRPDLILLDMMMPGMDGLEVLERLKTDDTMRSIPVVMLTAVELPDVIAGTYDRGADWHLLKPFDLPTLQEIITQLLDPKA